MKLPALAVPLEKNIEYIKSGRYRCCAQAVKMTAPVSSKDMNKKKTDKKTEGGIKQLFKRDKRESEMTKDTSSC